jgi:hypothetical protein
MTDQELADLIRIIRRAPLHNMDEAEAVGRLLQKLIQHLRPAQDETLAVPLRAVD